MRELALQLDDDAAAAIDALSTQTGKTEQEIALAAIQRTHRMMLASQEHEAWAQQAVQESLAAANDPADRAELAAAIRDMNGPLQLDAGTYADLYGQVCDVAERMWQHWPLDDGTGLLHTSSDARAAAMRIFEILGIEMH